MQTSCQVGWQKLKEAGFAARCPVIVVGVVVIGVATYAAAVIVVGIVLFIVRVERERHEFAVVEKRCFDHLKSF